MFKRISLKLHPDKGGNSEIYQELVAELQAWKLHFSNKTSSTFEDLMRQYGFDPDVNSSDFDEPTIEDSEVFLCLKKHSSWLNTNRGSIIAWLRITLIMQHRFKRYSFTDTAGEFSTKMLWIEATISWYQAWMTFYQSREVSSNENCPLYDAKTVIQNLFSKLRDENTCTAYPAHTIVEALKKVNPVAAWPVGAMPTVSPYVETLDVNQPIEEVFNAWQGHVPTDKPNKTNEEDINVMKQKLQKQMDAECAETLKKAKEEANKASEEQTRSNNQE
jgi:hypothetical protein